MKIAKRFMTLALATALGVGCATVGVSAAGSRTNAITVSDEQSAIYEIVQKLEESESFKELQTELPEVADAFAKDSELLDLISSSTFPINSSTLIVPT